MGGERREGKEGEGSVVESKKILKIDPDPWGWTRSRIFGKNPRTVADPKFQDPHISATPTDRRLDVAQTSSECAPAAPPIMLRIGTHSLNPIPNPNPNPNPTQEHTVTFGLHLSVLLQLCFIAFLITNNTNRLALQWCVVASAPPSPSPSAATRLLGSRGTSAGTGNRYRRRRRRRRRVRSVSGVRMTVRVVTLS